MINRGLVIEYGDIAPNAKENFEPKATESEFNTLSQLKQYNLYFPNYANPCELYQTALDGMATAFPSALEDANLGLWSEQITDENGIFENPVVLEMTSKGQYSSQGLTFTFDTYNNIYALRLSIKWLRTNGESEELIAEEEFMPTSAVYFCRKFVSNYNKLIITFYSLNMPQNRLKLRVIDYGYGVMFRASELQNVNVMQEVDPISSQISINTMDFILHSKADVFYSFQAKQPLSVYFNGELKSTTFIKSARRKSQFVWDIKSEDYIGLMDSIPFFGGIYNGKDAYELLEEIFLLAKVPYSINENLRGVLLYGYIPFTNCREALMQVAFAVQNAVDTSKGEEVKVFELDESVKQTIAKGRILQGQSFDKGEIVTGVEITAHSYTPISETITAYDAKNDGTGENIFVKFNEPLHDLSITNGEIISCGTNYAVINADDNCVLTGQKYDHTTQTRRKNNPLVLANEIEKIISIEKATLVSFNNIDKIMEKCYNWLVKTDTVNLKIAERKHVEYSDSDNYFVYYDMPVSVGDFIETETEYMGNITGTVIKQSFNLNGGIIVKDTVMR